MELEKDSNPPIGSAELKMFLTKAFRSFIIATSNLKESNESNKKQHRLSVRILMYLNTIRSEAVRVSLNVADKHPLKSDIIKAMKSNHVSVTSALNNLLADRYIIAEPVPGHRTKNKIKFQSCRYRLSLEGETFISQFMAKIITEASSVHN